MMSVEFNDDDPTNCGAADNGTTDGEATNGEATEDGPTKGDGDENGENNGDATSGETTEDGPAYGDAAGTDDEATNGEATVDDPTNDDTDDNETTDGEARGVPPTNGDAPDKETDGEATIGVTTANGLLNCDAASNGNIGVGVSGVGIRDGEATVDGPTIGNDDIKRVVANDTDPNEESTGLRGEVANGERFDCGGCIDGSGNNDGVKPKLADLFRVESF